MTADPVAALLLAAASLIAPLPARHRLRKPRAGRATSRPLVLACGVLGAAAAVVVAPPTVLVAAVLVVAGLAAWRRRHRLAASRRSEGQLVAAALEVLIGELRVGAHPVRAFATAGAESSGVVGDSLRAVAARARMGADVVAGLRSVALRSAVPAHWIRLAVFWELATRHGLPLSLLMRAAHRDIVDRQRFSAQTQAALAGARATAVILAMLPLLGILLGQLIGADPIRFLFGRGTGGVFLMTGVGLIGLGLAWAERIIDRLGA